MTTYQRSTLAHSSTIMPATAQLQRNHRALRYSQQLSFDKAAHKSRCLIRSSHTLASPSSSSSSPYQVTDLKSDTHTFTPAQIDIFRLLSMIASSASSSSWDLLTHLISFVPRGFEPFAIEAILPVQVFSGIPRTIEGAATVRQQLDERKLHSNDSIWMEQKRNESREFIKSSIRTNTNNLLELFDRLILLDDHAPPIPPSLSLTQPSLPPLDSSYPPICSQCHDNNSSAIRAHRGRQTLNTIYGSATNKLLSSLNHSHPALESSVHHHIYGHVLCTPILSVHVIELISIACLTYQKTVRQLFSHIRGALMNGCTRAMCEWIIDDAEAIYRYSDNIDLDKEIPWIDEARRLIVKIDKKVNPSHYENNSTKSAEISSKL